MIQIFMDDASSPGSNLGPYMSQSPPLSTGGGGFRPYESGKRSKMKEAVKEFEVEAEYDFYTLSSKKVEHVRSATSDHSDQEELMCSFRLVVPNFMVDLDSSQFNIFYNVTRNLLLAPPPPMVEKMMETGKRGAKKDNNFIIQRDQNKRDENGKLDIALSRIRDEVRDTIEHFINGGKFNLRREQGSARSNEITIKKGTWTLHTDNEGPSPIVQVYIMLD